MKTSPLSMLLLALFLIVYGILAVTNIDFAFSGVILGLLALAAGILMLFGR